jgi:hypothetical protein
MVLKGELAWICLMCCNSDILFNNVVIYWATFHDEQSPTAKSSNDSIETRSEIRNGERDVNGNDVNDRAFGDNVLGTITNISASNETNFASKDGINDFQMGVIDVKVDHIRTEGRRGSFSVSGESIRDLVYPERTISG